MNIITAATLAVAQKGGNGFLDGFLDTIRLVGRVAGFLD